jgi:hypothetical protein
LRRLARNILVDVGMVSELTERSVHGLSARYGKQLGTSPSGQIYEDARWLARDIASGGWRRVQAPERNTYLLGHNDPSIQKCFRISAVFLTPVTSF